MRGVKFIVPAIVINWSCRFPIIIYCARDQPGNCFQFGDPKKIVTKAGLNFKLPFIQNVVYLR